MAKGVSVRALLKQLDLKYGLSLAAKGDVGEEKAILFTPSRPLRDTLEDLAELFNANWKPEKNESGEKVLLLSRTLLQSEYDQTLRRRDLQSRITLLNAQVAALSETEETLNSRPNYDPIKLALSNPDTRFATELYRSLPNAEIESLFRLGRTSNFHISVFPQETQDSLSSLFFRHLTKERNEADKNSQTVRNGQNSYSSESPTAQPEEMEFGAIRFAIFNSEICLQLSERCQIPVRSLYRFIGVPLRQHGNPYSQLKPHSPAVPPEKRYLEDSEKIGGWVQRLQFLSETTGIPVISDFFPTATVDKKATENLALSGATALSRMDSLCRNNKSVWWNRGSTLLLRQWDWFSQREYEVPEKYLTEISKRVYNGSSRLTVRDLLELCKLKPLQLVGLERMSGIASDGRRQDGLAELLQTIRLSSVDLNSRIQEMPEIPFQSQKIGEGHSTGYRDLSSPGIDSLKLFARNAYPIFITSQEGFKCEISSLDKKRSATKSSLIVLRWSFGSENGDPVSSFQISIPPLPSSELQIINE